MYKPKTLSETVLSEVPLNISKNQKPQQKQLKIVENALGCAVDFQLQWGTQQSRFKLISTTRARARTLSERKAHMPQGHRHLRGCLLHTYVLGQVGWKKCCLCPSESAWCCWAQFVLAWWWGRVATNGNGGMGGMGKAASRMRRNRETVWRKVTTYLNKLAAAVEILTSLSSCAWRPHSPAIVAWSCAAAA